MGNKLEKIGAKQIGRNLITVINGIKYNKKTLDDKELKSITNKIELFNKKPTKELQTTIINLLNSGKEKEKKELVKKGTKKLIKKEVKKVTKKSSKKKVEDKEIDLIDEVRKAHAEGDITDEQIKSLQDLLKKAEEKKAQQEAPKTTSSPRRGEY